jgi:hypothetical protein
VFEQGRVLPRRLALFSDGCPVAEGELEVSKYGSVSGNRIIPAIVRAGWLGCRGSMILGLIKLPLRSREDREPTVLRGPWSVTD